MRSFDDGEIRSRDRALRGLARGLVATTVEAEDLAQETWLAALQAGETKIENVGGWMRMVARYKAFRWRHRERLRFDLERDVADPESQAESSAPTQDALAALADAVRALPEPYRTVIRLRYFEELSIDEIAGSLGSPRTTVKSQLHRGIVRIRSRMERDLARRKLSRAGFLSIFGREKLESTLGFGPLVAVAALVVAVGLPLVLLTRGSDERTPSTPSNGRVVLRVDRPSGADASGADFLEPAPRFVPERTPVATSNAATAPDRGAVLVLVVEDEITGAPLSDFDLWLEPSDPVAAQRGALFGRTDATGRLVWNELEAGWWRLFPQRGLEQDVQLEESRRQELRLVAPVGRTVRGLVEDQIGEPIAQAKVFLSAPRNKGHWTHVATTAADGSFRIEGADQRSYLYAESPQNHIYRIVSLDRPGAQRADELEVRLRLDPEHAVVRGQVLGVRGEPVAEATVRLAIRPMLRAQMRDREAWTEFPPAREVLTGADGRFEILKLSAFENEVCVTAPGYGSWSGIVARDAAELDVRLEAPRGVSGRVLDGERRPVPGATVELVSSWLFPSLFVRTDGAGRFRFENSPTPTFRIRAFDGASDLSFVGRFDAAPEGVTELELALRSNWTIRGRASDVNGQPLVGYTVVRTDSELGRPSLVDARSQESRVRTGPDGSFAFSACWRRRHTLWLYEPGAGEPSAHRVDILPGGASVQLRLERSLVPSARVSGGVALPDRGRLDEIEVLVRSESLPTAIRVPVDAATGSFRTPLLAPGSVTLSLWRAGFEPVEALTLDLAPDERATAGVLVYPSPGRLVVSLVTSDGAPLHAAGMRVSSQRTRRNVVGTADPVESLVCDELLPGTYRVELEADGRADVHTNVRIRPGEETHLALELQPGAPVDIAIHLEHPVPPYEGLQLVLVGNGGETWSLGEVYPTVMTGTFEVGMSLPLGRYTVQAWHRAELLAESQVDVECRSGPATERTLAIDRALAGAGRAGAPPLGTRD